MVQPSNPAQPSLKALYEQLAQDFASTVSEADRRHHIQATLDRIGASLRAPAACEGLPAELRERFDPSVWIRKIAEVAEFVGIEDETTRGSLARTIGERLVKLHTLASLMGEAEDLPDLRDHLVFAYVEAKSEWQQLNGIINYGIARGHEPSPETLARAVLISTMIAEFDDLFGAEHIEVLTDYLFAPLPNAHELTVRRHAHATA